MMGGGLLGIWEVRVTVILSINPLIRFLVLAVCVVGIGTM